MHKKSTGKGWNRSLRTWLALAATPAERQVWREGLQMKTMGEWPAHEDLVSLAPGVDGRGKWWGSKNKGER